MLGWALNLGFAGGGAVTVLTPYDDLTQAVLYRVAALRDASALATLDSTSLLTADIGTARTTESQVDDLNTTLWLYLTQ